MTQIFVCQFANPQKQFKALLVTTTRGWHHEFIHKGVLAIQQLGVNKINKYPEQFKVVIFLNTAADIFDSSYTSQTAFFDYDHDGDLDAYLCINSVKDNDRNALRGSEQMAQATARINCTEMMISICKQACHTLAMYQKKPAYKQRAGGLA